MICPKCNRIIDSPIFLQIGSIICPKCKEEIIGTKQEFKITEENNDYYVQSKIIFENALIDNDKEKYKEAFDLCFKSSLLGNPYAYYELGFYYDKDYIELEKSENERVKIAYEYYKALALYNLDKVPKFNGLFEDIKVLKTKSANSLLEMLSLTSAIEVGNLKYGYDNAYQELKSRGVTGLIDYKNNSHSLTSVLDNINYFVKGSLEKPVLGLVKITMEDLKELINEKNKLFSLIDKELRFSYIYSDKELSTPKMYEFNTKFTRDLNIKNSNIKNDEELILIFLNRNSKSRLFKNTKKLEKIVFDHQNSTLIRNINDIMGSFSEVLLYDKDLYYYLGSKTLFTTDAVLKIFNELKSKLTMNI